MLASTIACIFAYTVAVSPAAEKAQSTFRLVAQTEEALASASPTGRRPSLACPQTIQHEVVGTYRNVDTRNLSRTSDAILFRDIVVDGMRCDDSGTGSTVTLLTDLNASPNGTSSIDAQAFFLRGTDTSARVCGSYDPKYPFNYYFADDLPRFRTQLEFRGLLPKENEFLLGALKGQVYMIAQPFQPSERASTVVFNQVCTFLSSSTGTNGTNTTTTAGGSVDDDDDPDPTPDEDDGDGGSVCFPADAILHHVREDGSREIMSMEQVQLGMRIVSGLYGATSDVFLFTHRIPHKMSEFIRFDIGVPAVSCVRSRVCRDGEDQCCRNNHPRVITSLRISPRHLVYSSKLQLRPAESVSVGDVLVLADGRLGTVVNIERQRMRGVYAPHTVSGDLIVDGVLTSSYTNLMHPALAHALLAPLRWAHAKWGFHLGIVLDYGMDLRGMYTNVLSPKLRQGATDVVNKCRAATNSLFP